ncbi:MAG: RDD family protein, partial [Bdellovibrionota bacterium]
MKPGGFWRRFCARILDAFVILPITATLMMLSNGNRDLSVLVDIFALVLVYAYVIFCTAQWGQTVGKRLLRLKVVGMEGEKVSFVRAALRSSVEAGFAAMISVFTIFGKLSLSPEEFAKMGFMARATRVAESVPQLHVLNILNGLWFLIAALVLVFNPLKRAT